MNEQTVPCRYLTFCFTFLPIFQQCVFVSLQSESNVTWLSNRVQLPDRKPSSDPLRVNAQNPFICCSSALDYIMLENYANLLFAQWRACFEINCHSLRSQMGFRHTSLLGMWDQRPHSTKRFFLFYFFLIKTEGKSRKLNLQIRLYFYKY